MQIKSGFFRKLLRLISVIMTGVVFFVAIQSAHAAASWAETQPAGNTSQSWNAVASSSDGSHIIAATLGGRLYVSSNSGSSWTEAQPAGNVNKNWYSVASSSDGTHLIAGVSVGRLYLSSDSGANWTETQPAGNADKSWQAVASSSDGTHLLAGANGGRLYISTNSGGSWTETQPAGNVNKSWTSAASSSDGTTLIAAVFSGRLYISTNSGSLWTETQPAGNLDKNWILLNSSSDGTHLIAGVLNGRLYISSNSGSSWTETQPAGDNDQAWIAGAMSLSGARVMAGAFGGRLYISSDSGASWTETQPNGNANQSWHAAASSSDGVHLVAGVSVGRLYLGTNPLPNTTPTFSSISNTAGFVKASSAVVFSAVASDADLSDTVQLFICKANDFTGTACGAGGTYCSSSAASTNPSCNYTVSGADVDGSHTYYANVIDNNSASAAANPISHTFQIDITNPIVSAGSDSTQSSLFSQIGSATDAASGIATLQWTKTSGSGSVTFGSPTSAVTTISADTNATFVLRLTATDTAGNTNFSEFTLTWNAPVAPSGTASGGSASGGAGAIQIFVHPNPTAISSPNPGPTITPSPLPYYFPRYLGFGDRGPDVLKLQQLLQVWGLFPYGLAPTGYYGSITFASVKLFQTIHHLMQVGNVGPRTLNLLNSL